MSKLRNCQPEEGVHRSWRGSHLISSSVYESCESSVHPPINQEWHPGCLSRVYFLQARSYIHAQSAQIPFFEKKRKTADLQDESKRLIKDADSRTLGTRSPRRTCVHAFISDATCGSMHLVRSFWANSHVLARLDSRGMVLSRK